MIRELEMKKEVRMIVVSSCGLRKVAYPTNTAPTIPEGERDRFRKLNRMRAKLSSVACKKFILSILVVLDERLVMAVGFNLSVRGRGLNILGLGFFRE